MPCHPCDGCAADCCRGFNVVVQGWDVFRLARALERPPESFIELQGAAAPDVSHQLVLDAQATGRRYHRLALRRPSKEQGCTFLVAENGQGRCGVYAHRPDACRAYPAELDDDGRLHLAHVDYCPPGGWQAIDTVEYGARYRVGSRQRLIHDVVCDGWNERVLIRRERRSEAELFAFLLDGYARLERSEPAWFDASAVVQPSELEVRDQIVAMLHQSGWL